MKYFTEPTSLFNLFILPRAFNKDLFNGDSTDAMQKLPDVLCLERNATANNHPYLAYQDTYLYKTARSDIIKTTKKKMIMTDDL